MPQMHGAALIAQLQQRGDSLNLSMNSLVTVLPSSGRTQLRKIIDGHEHKWPAVPVSSRPLCQDVIKEYHKLCVDIDKYAKALAQSNSTLNAADCSSYLRHCAFSRVKLEDMPTTRECFRLPAASQLVTADDAATLRAGGVVVLHDVFSATGIDANALQSEIGLLHKHGVITPSNSSCNPRAHGVNLRCETTAERDAFVRQRTPTLLAAIDLLRSLPHALCSVGYHCPIVGADGSASRLAIPPQVLVSTYPPGAAYKRHLDCYGGDDNARVITLILYANPNWDPRDGGELRAEAEAEADATPGGGGGGGGGDGAAARAEMVLPTAGTLVAFESRRVWHEVRPSKGPLRFAVTLWVHAVPAEGDAGGVVGSAEERHGDGHERSARATLAALVAKRTDEHGCTEYVWSELN